MIHLLRHLKSTIYLQMPIASQENLIKLIATKLLNTLKPKHYKSIIQHLKLPNPSS